MPVAVISDVHSNRHALDVVLDHLRERGVDEILCLGDTVGYAAHPAECLATVREVCDLVLLGNHDHAVATGEALSFNPHARAGVDHGISELDDEAVGYLRGLEPLVHRDGLCLCHGSPRDPIREYVFADTPDEELEEIAQAGKADVVLMGHTHVPMDLTVGEVRLLNPGAVGQPRDGDPRASFALYDAETGGFEVVRLEYDVEGAAEAIDEAGLPAFNGERLRAGM